RAFDAVAAAAGLSLGFKFIGRVRRGRDRRNNRDERTDCDENAAQHNFHPLRIFDLTARRLHVPLNQRHGAPPELRVASPQKRQAPRGLRALCRPTLASLASGHLMPESAPVTKVKHATANAIVDIWGSRQWKNQAVVPLVEVFDSARTSCSFFV